VWVHGGVHGDWGISMWPFVRDAVQRGYVVITPDYRGSTGFGDAHYKLIDYGGKEVDDVISSVDYLKTLPYVDMDRLGIMGWSHGGFITSHTLFRESHPFRAGAAIVPGDEPDFPSLRSRPRLSARLRRRGGDSRPAVRERAGVHQALAGVSSGESEGPDAGARGDERLRRVLPRGSADGVHAARAEAGTGGDEDLHQSAAGFGGLRSHVQPPGERGRDGARRLTEQMDSWERTWTFFRWNLRPQKDIRVDDKIWKQTPNQQNTRVPPI
jgi:hypothetical protein